MDLQQHWYHYHRCRGNQDCILWCQNFDETNWSNWRQKWLPLEAKEVTSFTTVAATAIATLLILLIWPSHAATIICLLSLRISLRTSHIKKKVYIYRERGRSMFKRIKEVVSTEMMSLAAGGYTNVGNLSPIWSARRKRLKWEQTEE